jgi:hypothetical protein
MCQTQALLYWLLKGRKGGIILQGSSTYCGIKFTIK